MERLFSLDGEEIPNPFWSPLSPVPMVQPLPVGGDPMDEWSLQKFMEDALLHDRGESFPPLTDGGGPAVFPDHQTAEPGGTRPDEEKEEDGDNDVEVVGVIPAPVPAVPASEVADPVAYSAMLRRKLEADLAVVAQWKVASGSGGSSATNPNGNEDANLISPSSWEPSLSNDEEEGETETVGNTKPTLPSMYRAKRRKESNRDSARRSRNRKAAQLKDLEDQLSDLKIENNSLVRRLNDVIHKCNNSAVDCRVLTAKVETLETKLKMAEDNLMRATGTTNIVQAISAVSSFSIPYAGYPSGGAVAAAAVQDSRTRYIAAPPVAAHAARASNGSFVDPRGAPTVQAGDMTGASLQAQLVASLEQFQRRALGGVGGDPGPSSTPAPPPWGGCSGWSE